MSTLHPAVADFAVEVTAINAKRAQAIDYLRSRNAYRGDPNCRHRYEPAEPVPDYRVEVTVCRAPVPSVNHAVRG